jgi:hypothetical protein
MKQQPIHIKYGLSTGILLILLIVILYASKINLSSTVQMITVLGVIISGVILSCTAFKKENGTIPTNEIFFNGFRTTAIIALLVIGFAVLFLLFVPSFKNAQLENYKLIELKNAGTDAEKLKLIDNNVAQYKRRFLTMFIGYNTMLIVIAGLIGSFIGSILNRNK